MMKGSFTGGISWKSTRSGRYEMLGLLRDPVGMALVLSFLCCGFYFLHRKVTELCGRVRALEEKVARILQKLEDWERGR